MGRYDKELTRLVELSKAIEKSVQKNVKYSKTVRPKPLRELARMRR